MKQKILIYLILLPIISFPQIKPYDHPKYLDIKENLVQGWNTWNNRSVTSYVLLPECFSINLAFKQQYWLEEQYLDEVLIGRSGKYVEQVRPGMHTWDGSYTELEITWEQMKIKIQTATTEEDLVILVTPLKDSEDSVKMIVEPGILWNKPGGFSKNENALVANLPVREIKIFVTGRTINDVYVQAKTPYLVLSLDTVIGISTGKERNIEEIGQIINVQKRKLHDHADKYGDLAEAFIAIQAGIAWNTIYEPKFDRVVSTVGRLWNEEYGGFCLFGWDNFFLAYMTALDNHDLAIANIVEHMRSLTPEGFIPNDDRGNGSKSFDRSQPPVGGIMVWEIFKKYPEQWYLESCFDGLLSWNRWWIEKRMNDGLLSYGSHHTINPWTVVDCVVFYVEDQTPHGELIINN